MQRTQVLDSMVCRIFSSLVCLALIVALSLAAQPSLAQFNFDSPTSGDGADSDRAAVPPGNGLLGELSGLGGLGSLGGADLTQAQASFTAYVVPAGDNHPALLAVKATMLPDWYIYSLKQQEPLMKTSLVLEPSSEYRLASDFLPAAPAKIVESEFFDVPLEKHYEQVTFYAPIELASGVDPSRLKINGSTKGQVCSDSTCVDFAELPGDATNFSATLATQEQQAYLLEQYAKNAQPAPAATTEVPTDALGVYQPTSGEVVIRGVVEPMTVTPGKTAKLRLTIAPSEGWHVYARAEDVPEFAAPPTLITLTKTTGLPVTVPVADTKIVTKGDTKYHEGATTWTIDIPVPADAPHGNYTIDGLLGYQVCSATSCKLPSAASFRAVVTVAAESKQGSALVTFAEANYQTAADAIKTQVAWQAAPATTIDYAAINEAEQEKRAQIPMIGWLGMAFVAGFILNFMPCVLPVIGLKIMSFVQQAGEDRARVFTLNAVYSAGMISVFLVLATLAVFANFGWGSQAESTTFNLVMSAIVFVFALSFLGVWEIPIPGFVGSGGASDLASKEGLTGAFAKGILTTLLATPCTGPLLAPALAWAVEQPPLMTYLSFTCVGLGMAFPYLVIGANPQLIKFLPKPGAWMNTFKHSMGFVLLATVVFILSTLPTHYVLPTVAFLFALWCACWLIGSTPLTASQQRKTIGWVAGVSFAALLGLFSFGWFVGEMESRLDKQIAYRIAESEKHLQPGTNNPAQSPPDSALAGHSDGGEKTELPWQEFSQTRLEEEVAEGNTVFIDFTADWCVSCKANERLGLNIEETSELVQQNGIVTLKADLSNHVPYEIRQQHREMMAKLGNKTGGIPFYAVFPAGKPNEPILFSGTQTKGYFLKQLKKAGPSKDAQRTAMKP